MFVTFPLISLTSQAGQFEISGISGLIPVIHKYMRFLPHTPLENGTLGMQLVVATAAHTAACACRVEFKLFIGQLTATVSTRHHGCLHV